MSKYKVGDKVVLEITDKIEMEEPWYILSDATSIYGSFMDKAAEPLTAYIEQARADGAEAAWELARKLYAMDIDDKIQEAFDCEYSFARSVINSLTYHEAAAKVEAWEKAKEKPQKTILMDLLEKHPNIETEVDGLPKFCPFILGYKVLCSSKKTCKECWNRPLEQIGEE